MNENAEQKDRLRLWVEALRSGNYAQTMHKLRDDDGFCCLGVMCDVFMRETGQGKWEDTAYRLVFELDSVAKESLPQAQVLEWFGFFEAYTELPTDAGLCNIEFVTLNDDLKLSFGQIADLIEWNWDL
jgi:hypothetical protein